MVTMNSKENHDRSRSDKNSRSSCRDDTDSQSNGIPFPFKPDMENMKFLEVIASIMMYKSCHGH